MALHMPCVQQFAEVLHGMPAALDEPASSDTPMRSALLVESWPMAVHTYLAAADSLSPAGLVCDHQPMPLAPCV